VRIVGFREGKGSPLLPPSSEIRPYKGFYINYPLSLKRSPNRGLIYLVGLTLGGSFNFHDYQNFIHSVDGRNPAPPGMYRNPGNNGIS